MHYHATQPSDTRQTGIDVIGAVSWGSHFCQFYQTKQDLTDILVPYFKAGLEANEFCLWITSEPLGVEEAAEALRKVVPDMDRRLTEGQIEILSYTDWYVDADGVFERDRVLKGWVEKLNAALARGYEGLRLTGNTFWLEKEGWRDFTDYEEAISSVIGNSKMIAMCTYSMDRCGAEEVADVVTNHEFALMKRGEAWTVIESSQVKQSREEQRSLALFPGQNPHPVLRISSSGMILYANQGSASLLESCECAIGDAAPAGWRDWVEKAVRTQKVQVVDVPSGSRVFSLGFTPVPDHDYVNVYGSDVSERKRAEQALADANEELATVNEELQASNEELQAATEELGREIEERKKTADDLHRLNRTLRALSSSDQIMIRAKNELDYLKAVCRVIAEDCGHAMVWIGYAERDEAKSVRPVAHSGFEHGYLEALTVTWADTGNGRGPMGTAIRTGKPSLCRDLLTDPGFAPWREEAMKRGFASAVAVPLLADGSAFGAIVMYSAEADRFSKDELRLLTDLANDLAFGISALRLREAHAVINEELQATNDELRQEMALRAAAESALRESEAQYRTLFSEMTEGFALHEIICDERGKPSDYRFLEINPAFERLTGIAAHRAVGKTVREVIPGIENHLIDTYGKVALTGNAIHFENYSRELEKYFDIVAFSPSKGRFATIFVDSTERRRILERERHISEVLQRALVPDTNYDIEGCTVAVRYEPALEEAEVGGDFYDIFELGEGKLCVVIGDVAGKGLPAAVRVAAARHAIRSYAYLDPSPCEVLRLANNALCRDFSDQAAMLTVFYALVDTRTGAVTYGSGGHEPAYLRTRRGCVELLEASGHALGVVEGSDYAEQVASLEPGDTLVMLTDGITEARPRGADMFGLGGVAEFLTQESASSPDKIADGLLKAAKLHGGGSLRDDVVIVALRLEKNDE